MAYFPIVRAPRQRTTASLTLPENPGGISKLWNIHLLPGKKPDPTTRDSEGVQVPPEHHRASSSTTRTRPQTESGLLTSYFYPCDHVKSPRAAGLEWHQSPQRPPQAPCSNVCSFDRNSRLQQLGPLCIWSNYPLKTTSCRFPPF